MISESVADLFIKGMCETISHFDGLKAEINTPKQNIPVDYTQTEKIIHKMLTENTGTHLLDSGGTSGRNWQRNRHITDFRNNPVSSIDMWDNKVTVSFDIFHYLRTYLKYDKEMDKKFHKFNHSEEYKKEGWLYCMEEFIKELGIDEFHTTNTYNYENILSQVLQFTSFSTVNDEYDIYVILQTHNGCDVRGGYSTPHIFKVDDRDYFLIAQSDINVSCNKCSKSWYSDDNGYHWYDDSENKDLEIENKDNNPYHKDCGGKLDFGVMESY